MLTEFPQSWKFPRSGMHSPSHDILVLQQVITIIKGNASASTQPLVNNCTIKNHTRASILISNISHSRYFYLSYFTESFTFHFFCYLIVFMSLLFMIFYFYLSYKWILFVLTFLLNILCYFYESANLRALRAHVPACLTFLRADVPTCLACLRARVVMFLACLSAHVFKLRAITSNSKNKFSMTCFT